MGQDIIVGLLKDQVRKQRVGHAYLFAGPSGTGKTTVARILAAVVNCAAVRGGEPCGACQSCKAVARGAHWDVIETNGASQRGIDDVRTLVARGFLMPMGNRKVYVIDEAHGLTLPAWEALLTTLEEPPPSLIWILCTTQPGSIPGTVISRCQTFSFKAVNPKAALAYLQRVARSERLKVDVGGLRFLAETSGGNVRYAMTLLDQVIAVNGRRTTTRRTKAVVEALRLQI